VVEYVRRWGARILRGGGGPRRPRTTVPVAVVLAGAGVLMAFLFHLGVALGITLALGLAALWVAYLAIPVAIKRARPGRPVRRWDPVELGVHRVVGGGPLPPYIG
jgi:hypothetical protein